MNASSIPFAGPLVGWLADYYLATTLLLLITWIGWRWVRQPARRITAAWTVTLELLVLAVVCALPFWPRIALRPAAPVESTVVADLPVVANQEIPTFRPIRPHSNPLPAGEGTLVEPEVAEPPPPAPAESPWTWSDTIAAVYLAGAALAGFWLCWGALASSWICRRAVPADDSLRTELMSLSQRPAQVPGLNTPRLLISSRVSTAVALGLFRPTIVLPAGLAEGSLPHALRAVLAHEYAHIRRRDLWLLALGRCLFTVLFAHPLFWWLRRAIRGDQELLADAVAAGERRHDYAEALLRLVRRSARPSLSAVSAAVGIWEGSSQLSRRITMLLDETFRVELHGSRRWRYRAFGLLILLGAACSLLTLQPARSAEEPKKSSDTAKAKAAEKPFGKPETSTKVKIGKTMVSRGLYTTTLTDEDVPQNLITLPGYPLFIDQEVMKELHLTTKQVSKLRAIQTRHFGVDMPKFYEGIKDLPSEEQAKKGAQWRREVLKAIRKQVETILAPEQIWAIRELILARDAYFRLQDLQVQKKLGLTAKQVGRLKEICGENENWYKESGKIKDRALALLTPPQRARLREAALGPERPEHFMEEGVQIEGKSEPVFVPSSYPYPDLSQEFVQKDLKLNAEQVKQIRKILGNSSTLSEKLVREMLKLSPEKGVKQDLSAGSTTVSSGTLTLTGSGQTIVSEELKKQEEQRFESMKRERQKLREERNKQPLVKMSVKLRNQFEAVLTPEQIEMYKDRAFQTIAESALQDPLLLHEIGASDQQQTALRRLFREKMDQFRQMMYEQGKKMLKVLTLPQKEKLREEIERSEAVPPAAEQPPPANHGEMNVKANSGVVVGWIPGEAPSIEMTSPAGESTHTSSPPGPEYLVLPSYSILVMPDIQKELKLSAEQKKMLRKISADYLADVKSESEMIRINAMFLAPTEDPKKLAEESKKKIKQLTDRVRKRIEGLLTAEQLQALKHLNFLMGSYGMLLDPQASKALELSPEQQKRIKQFRQEENRRTEKEYDKYTDQTFAVLSPEQQKKLRPEVERFYRDTHEEMAEKFKPNVQTVTREGEEGQVVGTVTLELEGDIHFDAYYFVAVAETALPVYENLSRPEVQKTLGISADQQKQLQEIAAGFKKDSEKDMQELTQFEHWQKRDQQVKAVRRQIEKLLKPEQLTAMKDMIFRTQAPLVLADAQNGVREKIGLSDRQKADLDRISRNFNGETNRINRTTEEKILELLTPPQQEKLRAELDRRGWCP
ncbi:MAG: hypothetical protein JXB10_12510 [Pirellulales bacterium]|nr:hypothetical protein [Pirellulales bacterium]